MIKDIDWKILLQDPESFHCAIGPILAMVQLFGILPVLGICRPNPSQLKFAKFSFRTAYAVFINAMVLFMAILSVIHMIRALKTNIFELEGKRTSILCIVSYLSRE